MLGTVKWYNSKAGYGFIAPADPRRDNIFVNAHHIALAGLDGLAAGDAIEFDIELEDRSGKPRAVRLRRADD